MLIWYTKEATEEIADKEKEKDNGGQNYLGLKNFSMLKENVPGNIKKPFDQKVNPFSEMHYPGQNTTESRRDLAKRRATRLVNITFKKFLEGNLDVDSDDRNVIDKRFREKYVNKNFEGFDEFMHAVEEDEVLKRLDSFERLKNFLATTFRQFAQEQAQEGLWFHTTRRAVQEHMPREKYEAFETVAKIFAKRFGANINTDTIQFSTNRYGRHSWYLKVSVHPRTVEYWHDCSEDEWKRGACDAVVKITDHFHTRLQSLDRDNRPILYTCIVDEQEKSVEVCSTTANEVHDNYYFDDGRICDDVPLDKLEEYVREQCAVVSTEEQAESHEELVEWLNEDLDKNYTAEQVATRPEDVTEKTRCLYADIMHIADLEAISNRKEPLVVYGNVNVSISNAYDRPIVLKNITFIADEMIISINPAMLRENLKFEAHYIYFSISDGSLPVDLKFKADDLFFVGEITDDDFERLQQMEDSGHIGRLFVDSRDYGY